MPPLGAAPRWAACLSLQLQLTRGIAKKLARVSSAAPHRSVRSLDSLLSEVLYERIIERIGERRARTLSKLNSR